MINFCRNIIYLFPLTKRAAGWFLRIHLLPFTRDDRGPPDRMLYKIFGNTFALVCDYFIVLRSTIRSFALPILLRLFVKREVVSGGAPHHLANL